MARVSSTLPWTKYILSTGKATDKMEGLSCTLCFDESEEQFALLFFYGDDH